MAEHVRMYACLSLPLNGSSITSELHGYAFIIHES